MKRLAQLVIFSFAILAASPLVASASNWTHQHYPGCGHRSAAPTPAPAPTPQPTSQVPELDPNAAGAALALLVGGALLIRERRRGFAC